MKEEVSTGKWKDINNNVITSSVSRRSAWSFILHKPSYRVRTEWVMSQGFCAFAMVIDIAKRFVRVD